jgi:hypothetical protein
VTYLVVRFPELIGSWSWRIALDRRDKFEWIRSDGKDLEGRSKVVYSKRHVAASQVYHIYFSYLSSSSVTIFLRVLLYLEGRCCFDPYTLSSLLAHGPSAQNTANHNPLVPECQARTKCPPPLAMDIVLEIVDTFIFDPVYAKLLPGVGASLSTSGANATYSSFTAEPTSYTIPHATWQYEPSTHYFSLQPSQYAYMSAWARDDWRRQAITLFLITW